MASAFLKKLASGRTWKRLAVERLSEPLHLNAIAAAVAVFGSTRARINFDLYVRPQHAFGLLHAADTARTYGQKRVAALEFNVANGAGLLNICELATAVTKATDVEFDIVGFDLGTGMPEIRDFRDHPEAYQPGWYPMEDPERLRQRLPANAALMLGDLRQTVGEFLANLRHDTPIGFVSLDVDYYWSSVEALRVFSATTAERYLPIVTMYLDDVTRDIHNPWCGELAAVNDFNAQSEMRKIAPFNYLREERILKNARWIGQMYLAHILDHPARHTVLQDYGLVSLDNPYLGIRGRDGS